MTRQRFHLSVAVFLVLRRDDAILCLRRAGTGWMDGAWSVPAGAHEGGETLVAAAVREAREEVGVSVDPADARLVHTLHCRTGAEWLGAVFATDRWTGEPRLCEPDKHDGLGWYRVDALPETMIGYVRQALRCAEAGVRFSTFGWEAPSTTALA